MKKRMGLLTSGALILGCICGLIFREKCTSIAFLGDIYIKILKIMITPLIFSSISCTVYKTQRDGTVIKAIVLFTVMFTATFLLTSLVVILADPASGFVFREEGWNGTVSDLGIRGILLNLLPKSFSDLFINPKVFFVIAVSWVFGRVSSHFGADRIFEHIGRFRDLLFKVLEYFMYLTPLATFALMANTTYRYGSIILDVGIRYILTAWACGIIALVIIMIVPLNFIAGIGFREYVRKVSKIWIMTISTCSSAATLPYTVKVCKEEFGIPESTTDIVVPLGCTIHMCGGAVSFALLGLFCLRLYNVPFDLGTWLLMLVSSLLINMAAPGIPNGGVVIGATYLQLLGIPLGFIGFYSGIYKLLDMCYTTLNVTGDISANIILNKLQ
ncbi:MAG: dicarboxylate/amino acid:cation symporter [Erysipelotrichaceae bacterium]|nr:dicarboxylate/amino acid:cation symporter [Erysipelotrichaceae bacterium]